MNDIRLAIVGSRHYNNFPEFEKYVTDHILLLSPEFKKYVVYVLQSTSETETAETEEKPVCNVTIISGGADGADTLARLYAEKYTIPFVVHPAKWTLHGLAAGPIRNTAIVKDCTHTLAFRAKTSTGTNDTIRKTRLAKKPLTIIDIP